MTVAGLSDIHLTVKLTTRCGSKLTCEKHGRCCDLCLRSEVEKKLGDDRTLPHFSLERIYLHSKSVAPPPKPDRDVSVLFTIPRPGEIYGPYFRVGQRGHLINKKQAEELIGCEALSKKIECAHQSAIRRNEK